MFLDEQVKKTKDQGWEIVASTALSVMDDLKVYVEPSVITGRLRASFHVEKKGDASYPYTDDKGNSFEGKFHEHNAGEDEVIVGTNVIYAKKVDASGRAQGYFNKAVDRGFDYMQKRINAIT